MNYNSVEHSITGKAPSDLIFSFKVKCSLNMIDDLKMNSDIKVNSDIITTSDNIISRSQARVDYANERRRPSFAEKYKVGDIVITKTGQKRKLVEKVGSFSFKLDNGFTINTRNIRRKAHFSEVEDNWSYFSVDQGVNLPVDMLPNVNESPTTCDDETVLVSQTPLRRSPRRTRRPSYLKDYIT